MATYWPNDIGRHTGDTIPVQPWPAESATEVGHDDGDDIAGARAIVHAIVITVICVLCAMFLAAAWSVA